MRISTPTPYNSGYTPLKRRIAANRYLPLLEKIPLEEKII